MRETEYRTQDCWAWLLAGIYAFLSLGLAYLIFQGIGIVVDYMTGRV